MLKYVLGVLTAALIASPAFAAKPAVQNGQLAPASGKGMVVLALTAQSLDRDTTQVYVQLRGPDGKKRSVSARLMSDIIRAPGETSNTDGRLEVLTLPAGQYQFTQAGGSWSNGVIRGGVMNPRMVTIPMNQSITVQSGEVLYLGEINVQLNNKPSLVFTQNAERDYFYLGVKFGVTDTSNIQTRLLSK